MQDPRLQKIQEVLEKIDETQFAITKVALVGRNLQPLVGEFLRSMVHEAYVDGVPWKSIGSALGLSKPVIWRFYHVDEGPITSMFGRPKHRQQSKKPSRKPREE